MTTPTLQRIRWIALLVIVVSLLAILRSLPLKIIQTELGNWIQSLGIWGPVAFTALYIVATVCVIPGSFLTLLGGATFGLGIGFVTVSVGSVTGASLAYLIARYLARARVEQFARSHPRFDAVDQAISAGGWKIVALLRLSPAIPFNLQNYLYGLTDIKPVPYIVTSWLAMIPGTFLYVYIGHVAGAAATQRDRTIAEWVMLCVGLLATFVVTVLITRLARRKLAEQTELQDHPDSESPREEGPDRFPTKTVVTAVCLCVIAIAATLLQPRIEQAVQNWLSETASTAPAAASDL